MKTFDEYSLNEDIQEKSLMKEDYLLKLLNSYFENTTVYYNDINGKSSLSQIDKDFGRVFEKKYKKFGLTQDGNITALTLIATITDVLIDKRLSFVVDTKTKRITGVKYFKK